MSSILGKLFLSTAVFLPLTAGENAFARNLGSGSATVGAGSPIDWWTVYNGANLFVTDGGKTADIQVLSASAVTFNGGIVNPRNGYDGLRFFGGAGTISNSTINGTVALEQDWFAGSPTLVSITGSSMQGVSAYGLDTKLEISDRSAIVEATPGRNGVNATNHGIVNISDSTINVLAFSGHTGGIGAAARSKALITMKNTDIVVRGGNSATGILSYDNSSISMMGGSLISSGNGIIVDEHSSVNTNGVLILSEGVGLDIRGNSNANIVDTTIDSQSSHGIVVKDGGSLHAANLSVTANGNMAHAATVVGSSATAQVFGGSYKAIGINSVGIEADLGGRLVVEADTVTGVGTTIQAMGNNSAGIVLKNGSSAEITGAKVFSTGSGSSGVILSYDSSASLDGVTVVADKGPGLKSDGGANHFYLKNGTIITGGDDVLLTVSADSHTTLRADGNIALSGDIVAQAGNAEVYVTLLNGTYWFGATKTATSLSLDGTSHWKMSSSSDVQSLDHAGMIQFDLDDDYSTLTIGTLALNNGSFIINTKLEEGGDAAETDKIVVEGDASGNGTIFVRNNGGQGAETGDGPTDGIQVVEIGGQSDADFKLGAAAIIGIYDYQLIKADGQNWYLQTKGDDPVDPIDPPECIPGVDCPVEPPIDPGHIVDIVPGYNIALSAAQEHVLTTLDTFHERFGEVRNEDRKDGFSAWTRAIGKTGSYSPTISGYKGHGFDLDTAGMQFGGDFSLGGVAIAGDRLTFGLFAEYAHSSFDVRGRTADGLISSKGLGVYVSWQQKAGSATAQATGAYADALVKYDWLDFDVKARSVSGFDLAHSYKGHAISTSFETGYGFDLGDNLILQPQAQLTWSRVSAGDFIDAYGIHVTGQGAQSLRGRLGLRLAQTWYSDKPADPNDHQFVSSMTAALDVNVKREFDGNNGLRAEGIKMASDMEGTRYEVGISLLARMTENFSFYARGAIEKGDPVNSSAKGNAGIQFQW